MAGNSAWNKAVKQAFKAGRRTNKNFSLKDAMFAAKKIYKKGKDSLTVNSKSSRKTKKNNTRRVRGGGSAPVQQQVVAGPVATTSSSGSSLQFSELSAK